MRFFVGVFGIIGIALMLIGCVIVIVDFAKSVYFIIKEATK